MILLLNFKKANKSFYKKIVFKSLRLYAEAILNRLINVVNKKQIFFYEKIIHFKNLQIIYYLNRLQKYVEVNDAEIIAQFNLIYKWLLEVAQLRFRVDDFATLNLCKIELQIINNNLSQCFLDLQKNKKINVTALAHAIDRLEENHDVILQISAKEPYVFFLFIYSLRQLVQTISDEY